MWIRQLELQSFRNIAKATLELGERFNFLHGANGAGKTAVLESVHVLARGRSFRSLQTADLIRVGDPALYVRALLQDEHIGPQRVAVMRGRSGEAQVRINGESVRRMSLAAALLPIEVMVPAMVDLVFGGPGVRRQWLDWGLFHVKHEYLGVQRRYVAALRQRNACLKAIAGGKLPNQALAPWTSELADAGEQIARLRRDYLEALAAPFAGALRELSSGMEIELDYRQGWPEGTALDNQLSETVAREVKSGITGFGPHRADIEMTFAGLPCAATLSRGQAKVVASALMLAQADLIREHARRASVFLIDDIGAELDERHRSLLFAALLAREVQVIATSAERPGSAILDQCPGRAVFHVEQGRITPD